jgi:hypothetical protein
LIISFKKIIKHNRIISITAPSSSSNTSTTTSEFCSYWLVPRQFRRFGLWLENFACPSISNEILQAELLILLHYFIWCCRTFQSLVVEIAWRKNNNNTAVARQKINGPRNNNNDNNKW